MLETIGEKLARGEHSVIPARMPWAKDHGRFKIISGGGVSGWLAYAGMSRSGRGAACRQQVLTKLR